MMTVMPSGNPFSSRHIRPGAVGYLFPPGEDAATLVARLERSGWRGAIIGPHGSGKSTLLAALRPALRSAQRTIIEFALHDGQRRLGVDLAALPTVDARMLIVVDGYEQLGWAARRRLLRFCRSSGCGLLATAHRKTSLPTLFRTTTCVDTARALAAALQSAGERLVGDDDAERAFVAAAGDLREALFAMYDLYERRRRRPDRPPRVGS